jgi:hypothetical protein
MIDRLDSSIARPAAHPLDIPPPSSYSPPVALEYHTPQARPRRRGDMAWGIAISVLIANGVGWLLFGMLMSDGWRDDYAGPVAVGAAFIVLGVGIAGSLVWTRRQQQQAPPPPLRNSR